MPPPPPLRSAGAKASLPAEPALPYWLDRLEMLLSSLAIAVSMDDFGWVAGAAVDVSGAAAVCCVGCEPMRMVITDSRGVGRGGAPSQYRAKRTRGCVFAKRTFSYNCARLWCAGTPDGLRPRRDAVAPRAAQG